MAGHCRCGKILPTVEWLETPFQFCSQECADEEEDES